MRPHSVATFLGSLDFCRGQKLDGWMFSALSVHVERGVITLFLLAAFGSEMPSGLRGTCHSYVLRICHAPCKAYVVCPCQNHFARVVEYSPTDSVRSTSHPRTIHICEISRISDRHFVGALSKQISIDSHFDEIANSILFHADRKLPARETPLTIKLTLS